MCVNIKNRVGDKVEIGYWVVEKDCGKGIVFYCVLFLIEEVKSMGIRLFIVEVMDNNVVFEKVFIKNGFSLKLCFCWKYCY